MTRRGSFTAGLLVAATVAALAAFTGLGAATTTAGTPPANTSAPTIGGSATEGSTLTASSGSWSGDTPITFTYQWERCDSSGSSCSNISSATSQTYLLASGDVGRTLRVFVTATNAAGISNLLSSATSVVAAKATPPTGTRPYATAQPNISGTPQVGQTLTSQTGSWGGTSSISYSFAWERCDSKGARCATIKDATKQTYVPTTSDVGSRLRTVVTGKNSVGTGTITSNLTGVVAVAGGRPGVVAVPTLGGAAQVGATLTTTAGSWTSATTVHFTYAWLRCDAHGNNCAAISGAASTTYKATSADQGHALRSQVTATNSSGAAASTSAQTAVVAAATAKPAGKTVLVTSVNPPDRLVIAGLKFTPKRITSRSPFTARFRVTDTKGDPVQGALVYAVTLPYGTVAKAAEMPTNASGYATIVLRPTSRLKLRRGSIVIFVRARKAGDPLLTGISTRRLVQVLVR